jgi:hypothetical protein
MHRQHEWFNVQLDVQQKYDHLEMPKTNNTRTKMLENNPVLHSIVIDHWLMVLPQLNHLVDLIVGIDVLIKHKMMITEHDDDAQ